MSLRDTLEACALILLWVGTAGLVIIIVCVAWTFIVAAAKSGGEK